MKYFIIFTANDFGSTKTDPSESPKHNYSFLRASGNTEHFWCGGKLLNWLSAVAAHAIPRKLPATRTPHLNIRGSHHQNRKL
jgi:hypothetical protein